MKRVMVIGCPGAGKSTFSRALQQRTGLPLVHLDKLFWNADKTHVSQEEFRRRLDRALEQEAFILDGNYFSTMERRLRKCDTVFFLDYPLAVCLAGIEQRRGKLRPDMPWIETEPDPEFMQFVLDFPGEVTPLIRDLLKKYPNTDIFRFQSREMSEDYLHKDNEAFLREPPGV